MVVTGTEPSNNNDFTWNVYPNPARSFITIDNSFQAQKEYRIQSLEGRVLVSGLIDSENYRIDLSALPAGLYLLRSGSQSIKILKTE
jgi:hypothetical protein